ncbi:hypothetical protein FACS1894199_00640 [Bacteroidia bacterium]|nr:hypothetical protein FACS1894199_00640 [Bacteroidia bacterium]
MQKYGIDAVSTISDPMRECADRGMDVIFPADDVPHERVLLLQDKSDLLKVKPVAVSNGVGSIIFEADGLHEDDDIFC